MFGSANISTSYTFTQSESYASADQTANGTSQSVSSTNAPAKTNYKPTTTNLNKEAKSVSKAKENSKVDSGTDENSEQTLIKGNKEDNSQEAVIVNDSEFIPTSFAQLAVMVGGSENRVTKDQLMAYLKSMKTSSGAPASAAAITVVKNLIAQFDNLSNGTGFITSTKGLKEPQDYKTITPDQVTSPIDVRV